MRTHAPSFAKLWSYLFAKQKLIWSNCEAYLMISWLVQMSPWGPMQSAFDDKQPKNISEVDTSATIWTLSWHGHMGNKWATNGQQMCNKWAHGQQMGIYWKCDLPNSPFACPRVHVPICCPCSHFLPMCPLVAHLLPMCLCHDNVKIVDCCLTGVKH